MPEVFDQFNPPPYEGAVMGGETLVEPEGYVPAEKQIENMLLAGERLIAGRRESYDFGPDENVPDDIDIRARRPNYDLADATQDMLEIEGRLKGSFAEALEIKLKKVGESKKDDVELKKEGE